MVTHVATLFDGEISAAGQSGPVIDLGDVIPTAFVVMVEPHDDCIIPAGGRIGWVKSSPVDPFPTHDDKKIIQIGSVLISGSAGGSLDGHNTVPSYDNGFGSFQFDTRAKVGAFAVKYVQFFTTGELLVPKPIKISLYWNA